MVCVPLLESLYLLHCLGEVQCVHIPHKHIPASSPLPIVVGSLCVAVVGYACGVEVVGGEGGVHDPGRMRGEQSPIVTCFVILFPVYARNRDRDG